MRYLLDTCVISEPTKKRPVRQVLTWLDVQEELSLFLSVLTLGELQKGISTLPESSRRSQLQHWVAQALPRRFTGRLLPLDQEVASRWGMLTGEAERAGHPMPVLDGLLAATALVAGMTLVTRNTPHMAHTGAVVFDPWTA
ncbi:MAG: type II toxin-antitoxin system VapC family toxin [Candidatus Tectimicrobiota bacterium]